MTQPVLEARSIAASIPGRAHRGILEGLDLSIASGESVAIVGRSGSGKSTLLSILGLLQRPEQGTISVGGVQTVGLPDAELCRTRNQRIGFVFQDYALIRELTVQGNLEVPLDYARATSRKQRQRRVADVLELVGMAGSQRIRPGRLSGGEQQRVAIARALVTRPSIVLADEPTGALDTATGDEILRVMTAATSGAGSCLVVVTHDPVVASGADRVLRLEAGRLHLDSSRKVHTST